MTELTTPEPLTAQDEAILADPPNRATRRHARRAATQVAYPWRAAARTFVQTTIPAVIGLGLILPGILDVVIDGLAPLEAQWPGLVAQLRAWLIGAGVTIGALAALGSRLMAIPALEDWTRRNLPWLAAAPRAERTEG